jgi:hypothetical protein
MGKITDFSSNRSPIQNFTAILYSPSDSSAPINQSPGARFFGPSGSIIPELSQKISQSGLDLAFLPDNM